MFQKGRTLLDGFDRVLGLNQLLIEEYIFHAAIEVRLLPDGFSFRSRANSLKLWPVSHLSPISGPPDVCTATSSSPP
jgi:hypothetical protein